MINTCRRRGQTRGSSQTSRVCRRQTPWQAKITYHPKISSRKFSFKSKDSSSKTPGLSRRKKYLSMITTRIPITRKERNSGKLPSTSDNSFNPRSEQPPSAPCYRQLCGQMARVPQRMTALVPLKFSGCPPPLLPSSALPGTPRSLK